MAPQICESSFAAELLITGAIQGLKEQLEIIHGYM